MKRKPRSFDIFNLSFLDIISCGFGAVVLLVLIARNADVPEGGDAGLARQFLDMVLSAETRVEGQADALRQAERENAARADLLARMKRTSAELERALRDGRQELDELASRLEGLELKRETDTRAAIEPATAAVRDEEVGGIPVDSDYVVFIVDTSGSMQQIWDKVVRELENVIRIHPKIEGFQIINDNGLHLVSAYAGRWIPDRPHLRNSVIDLLSTWTSASNSSPVEGLEVALRRYVRPGEKVSIYIFGDDYTGGSFDPVIETLDRLNADPSGGQRARVHAVGFLAPPFRAPFAILMREVTRRNNGTFVALP